MSSLQWIAVADWIALATVLAAVVSGALHFRTWRLGGGPGRNAASRLALLGMLSTNGAMTMWMWRRWLEVNHFPSQTMSEVLGMFSFALLLSLVALHFALGLYRRGAGWAVLDDALVGLVMLGVFFTHRYTSGLSTAERDLPPALQSYWFPPHLSALIFSYATLGIAGLIALVYFAIQFWHGVWSQGQGRRQQRMLGFAGVLVPVVLLTTFYGSKSSASAAPFSATLAGLTALAVIAWIVLRRRGATGREVGGQILILAMLTLLPFGQVVTVAVLLLTGLVFLVLRMSDRLPAAEAMANLERDLDDVSFRAFAVGMPFLTGGLWFGAFWAQEAWANYWGWDSKENSALITWMIYVIYIHLRMLGGYRGKKAMAILLAGAFSIFFTFQLFGYLPDSQKSLHRYTDDNVVPREGMQGGAPAADSASVPPPEEGEGGRERSR